MTKPRVAIHKFSSCDGCQLALLNAGEALLQIAQLVDLVHFAEAGPVEPEAPVDIAFVEGSVSTPEEAERIRKVRAGCKYLVSIGACATAGGIQALRNVHDAKAWVSGVYASPEYISTLDKVSPIAAQVKVDLELWGCPVSGRQVVGALRALLFGVAPAQEEEKVCLECKRHLTVCVMVAKGLPCMGPVTRTGCGAICPAFGRDCYACYGPAENPNTAAQAQRLAGLGLPPREVAARFQFINNAAPAFRDAAAQASKT
jgi:coenzyme F420-reducing hydrogenase gamma subunit